MGEDRDGFRLTVLGGRLRRAFAPARDRALDPLLTRLDQMARELLEGAPPPKN